MIRKTILLVLSLASIATIVMGVLSRRTDGWVAYHSTKYRIVGQIYYGRVGVEFRRYSCLQCSGTPLDHVPACSYVALPWVPQAEAPFSSIPQSRTNPGAPRRSKLGIRWDKWVSLSLADAYAFEADNWGIQVPTACLFLLFATYPAFVFLMSSRRRRRYRSKHGLCIECGYNLTGNVSGVCPECSRKIEGDNAGRGERA